MSVRRLAAVALAMLAWSAPARAQDASRCTEAYVTGQHLMRSSHLLDAQAALLRCARDPCPAALRPECSQWLAEVQRELPSVVIAVRSSTGQDVRDARVLVDGQPFLAHLDGTAKDIDPGDHVVRLEAPGAAPLEQHVLLHEGEKARIVDFQLPAPQGASTSLATPPPAPAPAETASRPPRWIAYALGGLGIAATAAFAYFAIDGLSLYNQCHSNCSAPHVSAGNRDWTGADISAGVALVSFGAGAYLLLHF
ncbi:MAG TPA: hypothetical protein VF765_29050 [Polyangiaceae bacterium]